MSPGLGVHEQRDLVARARSTSTSIASGSSARLRVDVLDDGLGARHRRCGCPRRATSSSKSSSSSNVVVVFDVVVARRRVARRVARRCGFGRGRFGRGASASAAGFGGRGLGGRGVGRGLGRRGARPAPPSRPWPCGCGLRLRGDCGLAASASYCSHTPAISSSFATCSVGCAPSRSQCSARSPSIVDDRRLLARRVLADDLDEAAVARAAPVGDDDAVRRLLLLADAHQADLHGHDAAPLFLVSASESSDRSAASRGRSAGAASACRSDPGQAGASASSPVLPFLPLRIIGAHALHHLLHLLELLEQAVDVGGGRAAALARSAPAASR